MTLARSKGTAAHAQTCLSAVRRRLRRPMLLYIQILRFLAAFAVVAFHVLGAPPKGFEVPESALSFALSYGGRGVDLFFVISGFVIFYATHASKLMAAEFLRRRVERIVPLYFFVIFTVTMLAI